MKEKFESIIYPSEVFGVEQEKSFDILAEILAQSTFDTSVSGLDTEKTLNWVMERFQDTNEKAYATFMCGSLFFQLKKGGSQSLLFAAHKIAKLLGVKTFEEQKELMINKIKNSI